MEPHVRSGHRLSKDGSIIPGIATHSSKELLHPRVSICTHRGGERANEGGEPRSEKQLEAKHATTRLQFLY